MKKYKASACILGFSLLWVAAANSQVSNPAPPRPKIDGNGVDIQTGQVFFEEPGVVVGAGSAGSLRYSRTYANGGWRSNFDNFTDFREIIEASYTSKIMSYGDVTRSEVYTDQGLQTPLLNDGNDWGSLRDGTILDFTKAFFSQTGPNQQYINFLSSVQNPDGVVYIFHYKDSIVGGVFRTRVQSITSNAGYQLKFTYITNVRSEQSPLSPDWMQIASVTAINNAVEFCDPNADNCQLSAPWPSVSYSAVQTVGQISSRTTSAPGMGSIGYEWSPSHFRIFNPDGSVWKDYTKSNVTAVCISYNCFGNEESSRVNTAVLGGSTTIYGYQSINDGLTVTASQGGEVRKFVSDRNASGITLIDENNRSTRFDEAYGNVTRINSPEGDYFTYERDNRGNITRESHFGKSGDRIDIIVRGFPATCDWQNSKYCNKPHSVTDARGNTTTYTYSPMHGGVLTELGASVNGVSPLKRYFYVQRYARYLDASGGVVQAPSPIWLLSEERFCKGGASSNSGCSAGAGDEIVTVYDYGPDATGQVNNLMMRGKVVTADGLSLRTCYSYDAFGNKIAETSPAANLASCS